jgi:hypothetical protein
MDKRRDPFPKFDVSCASQGDAGHVEPGCLDRGAPVGEARDD